MAKGMKSVRVHRSESAIDDALESIATAALGAPTEAADTDPETVARRIMNTMLEAEPVAGVAGDPAATPQEFKCLGVDQIPFTGSRHVKFRQYRDKIPVYGSLVTVELDGNNSFVSCNSSLGNPFNVDPVAAFSPAAILKKVRRMAGYADQALQAQPRLNFYYDARATRWRLVYIVEDVLRMKSRDPSSKDGIAALPEMSDFILDAHTGELVDELPRTQTMAEQDRVVSAEDALGVRTEIRVVSDPAQSAMRMHDRPCNVSTHDFGFKDAFFQQTALPGSVAANPPEPWDASAVSAHANATAVAEYLRDVLIRDGLDGRGGPIVSSVNCVYQSSNGGKEWRNAARFRNQMIYGQRLVNNELRSYAVALDVVAHELLHGLTEETARLEYRDEPGALNESLSDIFGVIVANRGNADVASWDWEMGEDLSETGLPLRNLANPRACGQPDHMRDYLVTRSDHGGVHHNSGIHNKAAYNLLTAVNAAGNQLFTPDEVARLYYLTLTVHLSRTSDFSDCRAGLVLAARSMFDGEAGVAERIAAIDAAYDAVGVD